jgi:hypothetical protein
MIDANFYFELHFFFNLPLYILDIRIFFWFVPGFDTLHQTQNPHRRLCLPLEGTPPPRAGGSRGVYRGVEQFCEGFLW